jgi:purine-nucleoside/S-methyl-5'-thioadenosine phosphorylase / adenosine deaminase
MQYATSASVKMRFVKRSPYRSMVAAMRGMSVASSPTPMMFTLPKPNGDFRWVQLPAGLALVCDPLAPFASHFFTTRGWKLGKPLATEAGWIEVAEAAGVELPRLGRLHQVHGAAAVVQRKDPVYEKTVEDGPDEADIILTDDAARAITIRVADCLPILIVDRRTRTVGAAHAGWRGLAARVPIVTVERLAAEFGSRPQDLLVAIGPSIGACCYEVGEEVRARFCGFTETEVDRWFAVHPAVLPANPPVATLPATRRPAHWFFDGWQCARDQLASVGVPSSQVFVAELCTASHGGTLCSYRRDGAGATGRMVGVIKLRS